MNRKKHPASYESEDYAVVAIDPLTNNDYSDNEDDE